MGTDYLEELRGILVSGQEVSRNRALGARVIQNDCRRGKGSDQHQTSITRLFPNDM